MPDVSLPWGSHVRTCVATEHVIGGTFLLTKNASNTSGIEESFLDAAQGSTISNDLVLLS